MKVGIQTVVFPGFVPVLEQAVQVQDRGFDSFWAGEHHHYPESTPVPEFYKESGVPDFYRSVPDPLITLGAVTVAAPKLTLGTSIVLLPIHDVLVLSNQIATLDHLSNGKTVFSFGVGWNKPEMNNHGVEFETRVDKTFEQMKALRKMWTHKTSAFEGQFVNYAESSVAQPLQKPYPPLIMGGRLLKKNLQIIAETGDGWEPTDTYEKTYGTNLDADIEKLNGAVRAQGRDPAKLTNVFLYSDIMLFDRNPTHYKKDAPTRDNLARLERLGFKHVVIGVPAFSAEHFYGAIEHAASVAEPWLFQS
jgi:probable F420-dependent oxidoreductase